MRARASRRRQVEREQAQWEKRWCRLSHRAFACVPDAPAALERERQTMPPWLVVQTSVAAVPKYAHRGRPRRGATPAGQAWHVQAEARLGPDALEREGRRKAAFLLAPNRLAAAAFPHLAPLQQYNAQ